MVAPTLLCRQNPIGTSVVDVALVPSSHPDTMCRMVDSLIQRLFTTGLYYETDISTLSKMDNWIRTRFLEPYFVAQILTIEEIISVYQHAQSILFFHWQNAINMDLSVPMLPWDLVVREVPIPDIVLGRLLTASSEVPLLLPRSTTATSNTSMSAASDTSIGQFSSGT